MVQKRLCDICGSEIPDSRFVEHNEATKMSSGSFSYGAVLVEEADDLCETCGAKVRDFIRELKEARQRE